MNSFFSVLSLTLWNVESSSFSCFAYFHGGVSSALASRHMFE